MLWQNTLKILCWIVAYATVISLSYMFDVRDGHHFLAGKSISAVLWIALANF